MVAEFVPVLGAAPADRNVIGDHETAFAMCPHREYRKRGMRPFAAFLERSGAVAGSFVGP